MKTFITIALFTLSTHAFAAGMSYVPAGDILNADTFVAAKDAAKDTATIAGGIRDEVKALNKGWRRIRGAFSSWNNMISEIREMVPEEYSDFVGDVGLAHQTATMLGKDIQRMRNNFKVRSGRSIFNTSPEMADLYDRNVNITFGADPMMEKLMRQAEARIKMYGKFAEDVDTLDPDNPRAILDHQTVLQAQMAEDIAMNNRLLAMSIRMKSLEIQLRAAELAERRERNEGGGFSFFDFGSN